MAPMPTALIVLVAGCASGCAVRMRGSEHYFGPVLFRYAAPPAARAYVSEVRALGALLEAGTQWGVSLGDFRRVALAAAEGECASDPSMPSAWRWTRLEPWDPNPTPGSWHLSLFHLQGEGVRAPCFVRRVNAGLALTFGAEVNALSLGFTARTHMTPPADALSLLHFDASHPLDSQLTVWEVAPDAPLPVESILEEVEE